MKGSNESVIFSHKCKLFKMLWQFMCLCKYFKKYLHSVRLYAQNVKKLHTVGDAYGFLRVKSIWTYSAILWDVLYSVRWTMYANTVFYFFFSHVVSKTLKRPQPQQILWHLQFCWNFHLCLQPLLLSPTNSVRTNFIWCHLIQRISVGREFCLCGGLNISNF